jgi:hypothetical protein
MRGWTDTFGGGAQVLLGLSLALVGFGAFILLGLLGGYLNAMGAVALIVLTPVVLAELEFRERRVKPTTEPSQTPEPPTHRPITISEGATRSGPAGESNIRQVA